MASVTEHHNTLVMVQSCFRRLPRLPILFVVILLVGACATAPKEKENHEIGQILKDETGTLDQNLIAKILKEPRRLKSKSRQKWESEIDSRVLWWIHYDSVIDHQRFQRNLDRGENYRLMVQQLLRKNGLPPELYYLALIESGFVTHATSATQAVGIWQFEPETALNYGLKIRANSDDRKHPINSTLASSRYLTKLHRKFKSWYLAIAAYNAGEGRIAHAIRRAHTDDFWELTERGFLPRETMDYIPKFLAAATIGNQLEKFGFTMPRATEPWPEIASVVVRHGEKITSLSNKMGITEEELLRLNPRLLVLLSPAIKGRVRIWVPLKSKRVAVL